jgi:5'-nucleotidase
VWDFVYAKNGIQKAPAFLESLGVQAFVSLGDMCRGCWLLPSPNLLLIIFADAPQAVGNHEFDYGPDFLAGFAGNASFPVLSCNTDVSKEAKLEGKVLPFTTVTLPLSGKKVGIIGLTTPDTAGLSSPGPNVSFKPAEVALPGCIAGAKSAGAQIIIVLSHMGYAADKLLATNTSLSEIDLIVGGHSHTLLHGTPAPAGQPQIGSTPPNILATPATAEGPSEGPYPTNMLNGEKTIPVVQAFWGSRCAGHILRSRCRGVLSEASQS